MIYEKVQYPWYSRYLEYDSFEVRIVNDTKDELEEKYVATEQGEVTKLKTCFELLKNAYENYGLKEYNPYYFEYVQDEDRKHIVFRKNLHY